MAGLATYIHGVPPGCDQLGMRRVMEVRGLVLVTIRTFFRADEFGTGDHGWGHQGPIDHYAADEKQAPDGGPSEN